MEGDLATVCPDYGKAEDLELNAVPNYKGPAIIERSTLDELVVYFTLPPTSNDPGASGTPARSTLSGWKAMPLFPVGAKIWLSVEYYQTGYFDHSFNFALRDHEAGLLLVGAGRDHILTGPDGSLEDPVLEPALVSHVQQLCEAKTWNDGCSEPEILTYYSVEVEADAKVTFSDGETKSVTIGGVDYDASVSASVRQLSPLCVTDAVPIGGVRLQLVVKDLESRVAQLEVGESPAGDDAGPPP